MGNLGKGIDKRTSLVVGVLVFARQYTGRNISDHLKACDYKKTSMLNDDSLSNMHI
jgi:hypothetical protein